MRKTGSSRPPNRLSGGRHRRERNLFKMKLIRFEESDRDAFLDLKRYAHHISYATSQRHRRSHEAASYTPLLESSIHFCRKNGKEFLVLHFSNYEGKIFNDGSKIRMFVDDKLFSTTADWRGVPFFISRIDHSDFRYMGEHCRSLRIEIEELKSANVSALFYDGIVSTPGFFIHGWDVPKGGYRDDL